MQKGTKNNIVIKQAQSEDISQLIDQWRTIYKKSIEYKYPHRWKWQHVDNPFLTDKYANTFPVWVAQDHKKIIGWSCSMITFGKILDIENEIAYGVDLHVLSSHRGQRLGFRLKAENLKNHSVFVAIQMSDATRSINYKLGGNSGKPLKIFLKLLKKFDQKLLSDSIKENRKKNFDIFRISNKFLRGYDIRIIATLLSYLFKRKQKNKLNQISNSKNLIFEKVDKFGPEADAFWNRIKQNYGFAVKRDKRYLSWKYAEQPHMFYEIYYAKKDNQIVGILVLRIGREPEIKTGVIAELLSDNDDLDIYNEMLEYAENILRDKGAVMIRCAASCSELVNTLNNAGYLLLETLTPVVFIDKNKIEIDFDELLNTKWLMSLGDQDMDIPLLNQQPGLGTLIKALRQR